MHPARPLVRALAGLTAFALGAVLVAPTVSADGAPAAPVPDTTVTSGPADGSLLLTPRARFTFTSSEPGSSYVCALDDLAVPCDGTGVSLRRVEPGSHRFDVAARDSSGQTDPTPASRTFTVPLDDGRLTARGDWKVVRKASAYGHDYSTSSHQGDALRKRVDDVTGIVLVVGKGPALGPVDVYLGRELLATIPLVGRHQRTKKLELVATFPEPRSGRLKVVVAKDKPVRVEGVALVATP